MASLNHPSIAQIYGLEKAGTARHTRSSKSSGAPSASWNRKLVGGPDWIREQRFDIVGKSAAPATDAELWSMVRPLLEERFKFKYHREPREVSG